MLVNPFAQPFRFRQPFLIMSVKFAFLDILSQLDIVGFSQYSEQLVVDLSHALVRVVDELEDFH